MPADEKLNEQLLEIIEKLSKDQLPYRAEITTNSKGQAQIKARAYGESVEEIESKMSLIIASIKKVCRNANLTLAEK